MGLPEKNNSLIRRMYSRVLKFVFSTATKISPKLNTKLRYRYTFKKKLNLNNPKTFNEKLLWLKLNKYNKDPLVIKCADKFLVREYIKECGLEDTLNPLIGVWDNAEDIPWENLPQKFALKWNFGAGMNIICKDKNALDKKQVISQMKAWSKNKCWLGYSEMHYKYMPRKIICEEFIECEEAVIPDYKVYCFHGEPKAILVMHCRGSSAMKTEFFDSEWRKLETSKKYGEPEAPTPKPQCFDRLMEISRILSKPFPFVRCDFYIVGNKIYFGELTFTPAGGMHTSQTKIDGKDMTDFLDLDNINM